MGLKHQHEVIAIPDTYYFKVSYSSQLLKVKEESPKAPDPVEDSQAAYQRFVRRHSARAMNVQIEGETTAQKEAKVSEWLGSMRLRTTS